MWSSEILHYLSKADCHNKIFPRPQANDDLAKNISRAGSDYTRDNLMANDVFCYHVKVFLEFAKRAKEAPGVLDGMEEVKRDSNEHRDMPCDCLRGKKKTGVKSQKTELWERNFEWETLSEMLLCLCVFSWEWWPRRSNDLYMFISQLSISIQWRWSQGDFPHAPAP